MARMGAMRPLAALHFLRWLIEFLKTHNPMAQLRKMRDLQRLVNRLTAGRDTLIRGAAEMGFSERQIAEAAGLSQPRVHKIRGRR